MRFDSAVFLHHSNKLIDSLVALAIITLSFSHAPSQRAYTHCRHSRQPASYAGPDKASRPSHSSVQPFHFRAPRRRSPTRNYLVQIQVAPLWGERRWNGISLTRKPPSRLRHSGARHFFACPAEQSPHADGTSRSAHSDTQRFSRPAGQAQHAIVAEDTGSNPVEGSCALVAQR